MGTATSKTLARAPIVAIVVAIVAAIVATACSSPRPPEQPAPPVDPSRLSHARHAAIACVSCHASGQRPGANDHAPCDGCHREAFLGQPGALCTTCHVTVTTGPVTAPLKPYPADDAWQAEPSRFSHALHSDAANMEPRVGFHVECADCHVRDGGLTAPDHTTCARCHAAEARVGGAPPMERCDGCHERGVQLRSRARLIKGDLARFDHQRHREDRRGDPIRCDECHAQSRASTEYADHAAPRIERCVGCHDDAARVPAALSMRMCGSCHAGRTQKLTTLAPRNHLPATERPLDHTLAFRRDHVEAAADGARCAGCHTEMSGNSNDACDECHRAMKPADHRITFRELDHGTEAAANRDRCARCHVIEFCTACHEQRPRSHGVYGEFELRHGQLARTNIRACVTCHDQQQDCAPCHQGSP